MSAAETYQPEQRVWVYRDGGWRPGVVQGSSPRGVMVWYRPGERPNATTDTVTAIFVMPRYEVDPWLDLEAPAAASPAVRAVYRGLAAAGAVNRQAAVRVMAVHPDRRAVTVAEVLGILDRFPPEESWDVDTDEAFLGLLRDITPGTRLADLVPGQLSVSTGLPPPAGMPPPDDASAPWSGPEVSDEDVAAALLLMAGRGVLTANPKSSPGPDEGTPAAPGADGGG